MGGGKCVPIIVQGHFFFFFFQLGFQIIKKSCSFSDSENYSSPSGQFILQSVLSIATHKIIEEQRKNI